MRAVVDEVKIEHLPDEDGEPVLVAGNVRMGVRAVATVRVHLDSIPEGHVLIQTISTGGLWGIETADPLDGPDKAFLGEVEQEQLAEMREILAAFGLRQADDRENVPYGSDPISDAEAMDRLAAKLNEPGQWNGGDVCEVAATLCVRSNRRMLDEGEDEEFGEVELTPFRRDPDTSEAPEGVLRLDRFEDGALVEDAEGRLFNVVRQGPTQGSTEIVDDEETHAYYDCGTLVRRHGPKEED